VLKKVNHLIVGQGIAGSVLAVELLKTGDTVCVYNLSAQNTSSMVAAGLYNPITGRKMVKTWIADEIFPLISPFYNELEKTLNGKFHYELPIYRPFVNIEEQNDWNGSPEDDDYKDFIGKCYLKSRGIENIVDPYGGLELKMSGYVDIPKLLHSSREFIKSKGLYVDKLFDINKLVVQNDSIRYEGIHAENIIFCEGSRAEENPLFDFLKFRPVKGEIMDIQTEDFPSMIVNRGVFMLPRNGYIRVGATYENKDLTLENTDKGINVLKDKLIKIFSGSYRIIRKDVGIRPATFDRRPYIGHLAKNEHINIFNGFGTKGVSLVPFFTKLFVQKLRKGDNLPEAVRLDR